MMKEKRIETGLGNYYGEVVFLQNDNGYFLELGNWDDTRTVAISKDLLRTADEWFNRKQEGIK